MKKNNKKTQKDKFIYLVYCNPEPIVYEIFESKHDAVRYAINLIRYRKNKAKERGYNFSFYHFHPLPQESAIRSFNDSDSPYYRDPTLFSVCLSIPEERHKHFGDDSCHIRVIRRVLRKKSLKLDKNKETK